MIADEDSIKLMMRSHRRSKRTAKHKVRVNKLKKLKQRYRTASFRNDCASQHFQHENIEFTCWGVPKIRNPTPTDTWIKTTLERTKKKLTSKEPGRYCDPSAIDQPSLSTNKLRRIFAHIKKQSQTRMRSTGDQHEDSLSFKAFQMQMLQQGQSISSATGQFSKPKPIKTMTHNSTKEVCVYHGTSKEAAQQILSQQVFKLPSGLNMDRFTGSKKPLLFGNAVYFADDQAKARLFGCFILKVLLRVAKSLVLVDPAPHMSLGELKRLGCDSVRGVATKEGTLNRPEWAIFDVHQVVSIESA
jgi:hypothetical protein